MSYTIDDIKSLSFREGVRTRIQMYLGSADNEGAYQAIKEIINNSTDEALCGYGNQIDISVDETNNTIEIQAEYLLVLEMMEKTSSFPFIQSHTQEVNLMTQYIKMCRGLMVLEPNASVYLH